MPTNRLGIKAVVYTCKNTACKWYNTGWSVQFNPDGSIPDARDRTQDDREPRRFERVNPLLFNQRSAAMLRRADEINRDATDPNRR
jgi:hypothetical protein